MPGRDGVNYYRNYWQPHLNEEMEDALAKYPPGTLLVKADRPGDTIDGQEGWVKA